MNPSAEASTPIILAVEPLYPYAIVYAQFDKSKLQKSYRVARPFTYRGLTIGDTTELPPKEDFDNHIDNVFFEIFHRGKAECFYLFTPKILHKLYVKQPEEILSMVETILPNCQGAGFGHVGRNND